MDDSYFNILSLANRLPENLGALLIILLVIERVLTLRLNSRKVPVDFPEPVQEKPNMDMRVIVAFFMMLITLEILSRIFSRRD